jgi:hypothetical protein
LQKVNKARIQKSERELPLQLMLENGNMKVEVPYLVTKYLINNILKNLNNLKTDNI